MVRDVIIVYDCRCTPTCLVGREERAETVEERRVIEDVLEWERR